MGSRLEKGSEATLKKIEDHTFVNEEGEEYDGSKFGGFSDYFRRKKLKLQNLDAELRASSSSPLIFKGIVAHVNGYTQPSLNDLHHMIVRHGGGFMQYLDGKTTVTHIIAANLTPKKAVEFKRYRMVKPAWIVDSIEAGKVLPWENYRLVDEGPGQRLLGFNDGTIVSQANTQQRSYREQTNSSWYRSQVKQVAEDIDDDSGARFPRSQPLLSNKADGYVPDSVIRHRNLVKPSVDDEEPEHCQVSSNSDSFDVTSSLEDALKAVDNKESSEFLSTELIERSETYVTEPVKAGDLGLMSEEATIESPRPQKRPLLISSSSPSKRPKVLSAEEHNALLLADPKVRKSSTANPDFLKQFYSESRLHHLSTWKADLKARLQQMAAEKSLSQKPQKRRPGSRRYVMHVDFDSFFCAVSLKNSPEFVDKPAVVAHGSGTGSEIASCNYPARTFGVKNGMWMKKALELCPDIKVLAYDFPAYEQASHGFYEEILDVGGIVQSVSVDEALIDISSLCIVAGVGNDGQGDSERIIWREQETANKIGQKLRERIKDRTGCAVSVGIGGNILLAKVALRKAKPAGQYLIKPEEALDFVGLLTVQDLPGVAYSIGRKLEEIGIKSVSDVRSVTKERLVTVLGPKTGEKIWEYSKGIDRTEVGEQVVRKSVSAEINWGIRFISQPEAEEFVQNLCGELQKRLLDAGVKGRQVTMKIMRRAADAPMDPPKHLGHGKCDVFNKSVTLGVATYSSEIIGREAISILRSYGFSPGELRGLGIQMTKLELIKPKVNGQPEGSQRRIAFNTTSAGPRGFKHNIEDIDDPEGPHRPGVVSARPATIVSKANETDKSMKKPLNLMGTQFIIPTQFDPTVLAALPQDIRSKLLAQSTSASTSRSQSPARSSRSHSPIVPLESVPLPSQFDPEVFSALPEDMKAEVLASYGSRSTNSRTQTILPQSPQKLRALPPTKKVTTPTKKRPGLLVRGRNNKGDSNSTLTQSNFVTGRATGKTVTANEAAMDSDGGQSDLDPDFLAALPPDVRAEVIAEHRRSRLARRSGLGISSKPIRRRPPEDITGLGQKKVHLAPRLPKPTFTTHNLSSLPELRETMSEWHHEFRAEGPHGDDVAAMERYLRRVVCEERDVGKAIGVCKWLTWLIDEDEGGYKEGRQTWQRALKKMKETVNGAVQERGRGKVEF